MWKQEWNKVEIIERLPHKITADYTNIMAKLAEDCKKIMGEAPCTFAIIGMGSLARKEITPFSDFEHVIVLGSKFNCANEESLTLEGPSTSIDVFSFRNACKMASVKSYDTIFSEFYFFINTCLLSKFQDFSASGYRKKYVTT